MELYSIYNVIYNVAFYFKGTEVFNPTSLTTFLLIATAVVLALFALQGYGLYKMGKNRGMAKCFLAFIPFANFYFMGKLAGKCTFFGREMKGAHVYAMVAQAVTYVCCILMVIAEIYLSMFDFSYDVTTGLLVPTSLSGAATGVYTAYDIGGWFLSVIELVSTILTFVLIIALYKSYNAKNYMILSMLYLFVPFSRYIVIPVLCNNPAVNYDEYVRKQREEYYRRHQQQNPYGQYGNPYQPPYGNPYQPPYNNGYGQSTPTSQAQPQDPFEEFSSAENDAPKGEGQSGGGEDEFFS